MKLEVGKWCRTKKGTIFKIIGGNIDMWEIDIDYSYLSKCENEDYNSYAYNKNNSLFEELVVKASYNIIDILEVGDYVNGYKIVIVNNNLNEHKGKCNSLDTELWYIDENNEFKEIVLLENDIKSIITHEQMEQTSYKLGE